MDDFHFISEFIEKEVSNYFFISLVTYKRFFRVEFSLCLPAPQLLSAFSTVNFHVTDLLIDLYITISGSPFYEHNRGALSRVKC